MSPKLLPRVPPGDHLELQGSPDLKKPQKHNENRCFYDVHNIALRRPWDALFSPWVLQISPQVIQKDLKDQQKELKGQQMSPFGTLSLRQISQTSTVPSPPQVRPMHPNSPKSYPGLQISPIVDICKQNLGAIFLHMNFNDTSKSPELPQRKKDIEVRRCRVSVLNNKNDLTKTNIYL